MKKEKITNQPVMVKIKGSEKASPETTKSTTINTNDIIEVTIRIRRKKSIEAALKTTGKYSHTEYEKEFGS